MSGFVTNYCAPCMGYKVLVRDKACRTIRVGTYIEPVSFDTKSHYVALGSHGPMAAVGRRTIDGFMFVVPATPSLRALLGVKL